MRLDSNIESKSSNNTYLNIMEIFNKLFKKFNIIESRNLVVTSTSKKGVFKCIMVKRKIPDRNTEPYPPTKTENRLGTQRSCSHPFRYINKAYKLGQRKEISICIQIQFQIVLSLFISIILYYYYCRHVFISL